MQENRQALVTHGSSTIFSNFRNLLPKSFIIGPKSMSSYFNILLWRLQFVIFGLKFLEQFTITVGRNYTVELAAIV